MALLPITGQAVDFGVSYFRNRCDTRDNPCYAEQADTMSFQILSSLATGVQILSDNDFTTGAPWTFGGDWAYDAGDDEADCTGVGALSHTCEVENGGYYKVTVTVTAYAGGILSVEGVDFEVDDAGTFTVYFQGDGNAFALDANGLGISISQVDLYRMSNIGLRVYDCETETIQFSDYLNTNAFIEYFTGVAGTPNAQVEWTWSDLGLNNGCYYICLVDITGPQEELACEDSVTPANLECTAESCCYMLEDDHGETLLLQWTNTGDVQVGSAKLLDYTNFTYNQFLRIKGQLYNPTWEHIQERYDFSSGQKLLSSSIVTEKVELKVNSATPEQFRAISFGLGHTAFYVEGIRHFMDDSGLDPEWRRLRNIAPASIQLTRDYDQLNNSYCDPQPINCTDDWTVNVIFQAGHDSADIEWRRTGEFQSEFTDGASTFTYDGDSFAAWAKTGIAGQSVLIIRSDNSAEEVLTLSGNVT